MKYSIASGIGDSNVLLALVLGDYGYVLFCGLIEVNWEKLNLCRGVFSTCCSQSGSLVWRQKYIMAEEGSDHIELKFRIYDGTDIAHSTYGSLTTIAALKQKLVSEWPQDKSLAPKTVNDLKLIHAGKVLENNKTLSESRIHDGAFTGGVITMHVVIQPVLTKKKTAKYKGETGKLNSCGCTVL